MSIDMIADTQPQLEGSGEEGLRPGAQEVFAAPSTGSPASKHGPAPFLAPSVLLAASPVAFPCRGLAQLVVGAI